MELQSCFSPEGALLGSPQNTAAIGTEAGLREAMMTGQRLEARVRVCDGGHNLHVELPCMRGLIPRSEGALGISEGTTRDIALISRVNKPVCFSVLRIEHSEDGTPYAVLSRRLQQEHCRDGYISRLQPGDVIPARVTHLAPFGCFVDIGCGVPSLIPIDAISVSRISHPADRFRVGEEIRVMVKGFENGRILLTHKELLGTWEENAACFSPGETVAGIVRSVEDYGVFIELAPNLAGLADLRPDVRAGQHASVYIKSIVPDRMKIKLAIVDVFDEAAVPPPVHYFFSGDHMDEWVYTPPQAKRRIATYFSSERTGGEPPRAFSFGRAVPAPISFRAPAAEDSQST
ncbi:MAG: S1 RNA-binding domain-containing protein [Oscillospiraceae bacterium]|nr:S1 RNA-binding domain-containing protein [Oscillospiraceae bacterium]